MKVLLNNDNVVIAKGNIEDLGNNSYKANGSIFGTNLGLTLVETNLLDADIVPQRDKIVDGVKVENVNLQSYLIHEKQKAQDELMLELIEGGLI